MNNSSFVRKIIYIAIITALLLPLSLVSRPATRDAKENRMLSGGMLAKLRDKHDLSQSKMAEIDPASETMKLASLGLRGVAVNLLWMQAIEQKKKEQWNQFESTLNALVKIQPNFIKVWEYQAHNMSYNISKEFDDYQYRYHWVKKGINFLTQGIAPNYRDHRMTDNLGFFTGMKIGYSDEKKQFRRLFRGDDEFHSSMEEYIDPQSYRTQFGHDNWKMAYQWYRRSINLVDDQSARRFSGETMFYMRPPAQLRNLADALQDEFRSGETHREIWVDANREWKDYGNQPIRSSTGQQISLEALSRKRDELERKREELDGLAPEGTRDRVMEEIMAQLKISPEEQEAMDLETDRRTDLQEIRARKALSRISAQMMKVDILVSQEIPQENLLKARRISEDMTRLMSELRTIDKYQGTVNYRHWRIRTTAEMSDEAIRARQLLFDAEELARKSIFDDEYEIDPESGEKVITRKGAISTYEDAFTMFNKVMVAYPSLMDGEMADKLTDTMYKYLNMLKLTGLDWPMDFPMQDFVDYQFSKKPLGLPSTEILLKQRLERGEIDDEEYERLTNPDNKDDEGNVSDDTGDSQAMDDADTPGETDAGDDSETSEDSENSSSAGDEEGTSDTEPKDVDQSDPSNAKAALNFDSPGLAKEKPESGPFVEVDGGFMVPYTTQIPGTEVSFEMIPIPGGKFMMGSPEDEAGRNSNEGPQFEVELEPYWMGKYEVTWGEYKPFMRLDKVFKEFKRRKIRMVDDESRIDAITAPSALYDPSFTYDAGQEPDQPCATIAQFAAKQYTKYLSLLTGTYYRLPYEAEWEHACRGGTTTAYYFGDDPEQLGEHAWFEGNSKEYRYAVGQLKPNPFGLYDMYGNVNEWVLGQYVEGSYDGLTGKVSSAVDTFNKPTELHPRVCRGGSFETGLEACRSAARQLSEEVWRDDDPNVPRSPWWFTKSPSLGVGFRLMRPLHEPTTREAKEALWNADLEDIEYDAKARIESNGKGAFGIVGPDLPEAIKGLSKDK